MRQSLVFCGKDWRKTGESSATSAVYPLRWNIEIPSLGYNLDIQTAFEEQEMATNDNTGISYWEGAIEVVGDSADGEITGRGYMELTGCAEEGLGSLFERFGRRRTSERG